MVRVVGKEATLETGVGGNCSGGMDGSCTIIYYRCRSVASTTAVLSGKRQG